MVRIAITQAAFRVASLLLLLMWIVGTRAQIQCNTYDLGDGRQQTFCHDPRDPEDRTTQEEQDDFMDSLRRNDPGFCKAYPRSCEY